MPRSRYVRPLTDQERDQLVETHRSHPSFALRHRAQAILLSAKGHNLKALQATLGVSRDTVSAWLDRFEASGVAGLAHQSGAGRPPLYTEEDVQRLKGLIDQEPRSPRQAWAQMQGLTGKKSCLETVKRALKKSSSTPGGGAGSRPRADVMTRNSGASRPTRRD